jgi:hypothetical protein
MYVYKVAVIGSGTDEDPYRPDLPLEVVTWSQAADAKDGMVLISTPTAIEGLTQEGGDV